MSFVHPFVLWGLLFASIPTIIYFLMRFRAMRVPWGATYVLERALERIRKKLFLKQLILLALRTLAVVFIVLAFARPMLKKQDDRVTGTGVHHFVLVDASYSMETRSGGETVWRKGHDILRKLVSSWGRGEQWSLYVMDEDPGWRVESETVETPEKTVVSIDSLGVRECSVSLATGLKNVLDRAREQTAEIFILGDDQRQTWEGVSKTLEAAGDVPPVYWICPEIEDRQNLAVTRVRLSQQKVLSGHPVNVYVAVRNFGTTPARDVELEALINGTFEKSQPVSVLPGQENEAVFELTFEDVGSHAISARLAEDALEFDNAMGAGVEVVDKAVAAVLVGQAEAGKYDSSAQFLALIAKVMDMEDRRGAPLFTEAPLVVETVSDLADSAIGFDRFDALVVDGNTALNEEVADWLRGFVDAGGALILAADQNVDSLRWNELLGDRGLLPARLGRHVETPLQDEEQALSLSLAGVQRPCFRVFETEGGPGLSSLLFHSWTELEAPAENAAALLLFDSGEPYAVSLDFSPGRVILLASGLNSYKNNLLARPAVYPLVTRLVAEAGAGTLFSRTVARTEPVRLRFAPGNKPVAVHLEQRGRESTAASFVETPEYIVAKVPGGTAGTGVASLLVLINGDHRRVWFGIQGERSDSDLRPVAKTEINDLQKSHPLTQTPTWQALSDSLAQQRRGRELYFAAIGLLLLALFGEMFMELLF